MVVDKDKKKAKWERITNQKKSFANLLKWIKNEGIVDVVLEASGGYERKVAEYLAKRGVAVRVVNPAQARSFARGDRAD